MGDEPGRGRGIGIRAAITGGGALLAVTAAGIACAASADEHHPTYRIGIYDNPPKISRDADGKAQGFFAEILVSLARQTGFRFTYVPCDWSRCLDMLERGEIDIMPDVAWTTDRESRFEFGHEAVLHGWSLVYRQPGLAIESLFHLRGRRIAVLDDSIQHRRLTVLSNRLETPPVIVPTASHAATLAAVEDGTAEAGIVNQYFGAENEHRYRIERTPIAFEPSPVFFAFSKLVPQTVAHAVDAALGEMKGDPSSPYYRAKSRWLDINTPWQFPGWAAWLAATLFGVLVFSIVGNAYLRRKVATATASLRESEGLLDSIFENVPVALLIKNADHVVVRPNRTYLRWYGLDLEQMAGRRSDEIEDFQADAEAQEMNAQENQVLRTGRTQARQVRRPFADGREHIISITKFPVYDHAGNISKVGSVSVDLTDEIAARKALAANEERFRDFAESASDWLWETGGDHRFTYFSERHGDAAAFSPAALAGRSLDDVIATAADGDPGGQRYADALRRREPFRDCRCRLAGMDGGTMTISLNGKPVFGDNGEFLGYRGTGADITLQIRAQEVRDAALVEAERANRAKSQFLAIMSHDLRTPLNAILGFSEVIEHEYFGAVGGKYREYARDIRSSGQVLLSLVNEILDLSAIESGKRALEREAVSLPDLIAECELVVSPRAREGGVTLGTALQGEGATIHADRRALRQILLNLLSNAVKFTPAGGSASVIATVSGAEATIVIADTGRGMPAGKIQKLMEPFVQGDEDPYRSKDGWGLGLAIAKSLIDLHGGSILIDSVVGKGTTITVTIPAAPEAAATASPPED